MAFALTYQDYLNSLGGGASNGGSEGGQGNFSGLSEADWNKLSDAQKWQNVGGGLMLAQSDPRYAQLTQGLKPAGDNNRLDGLLAIGPGQYKPGMLTDTNNIADLGNGVNATYWGNFSPMGQRDDTSANWLHEMGPGLMIAAALLSGGAAAGAMGAGAGAGGAAGLSGSSALATGGFGTDIAAGSGAFGGAAGAAGTAGAAGSPGSSYWNMTAQNGTTDVPVGEGAPVVDHSVAASGLSPQGAAPVVDHSFNSAGGLLGNITSGNYGAAASQAGSWLMSHPLQAAGLLQTGYGLVHGPAKPSSGSSSSSKGGNGNASGNFNVPQQHFYVNPYIAAQIQRGY